MAVITRAYLEGKRQALVADLHAIEGAIQVIDQLIEIISKPDEALTLDELAQQLGATSAEVVSNEG